MDKRVSRLIALLGVTLMCAIPLGPVMDNGVASAASSRHYGVRIDMAPAQMASIMFIHSYQIKTANVTIYNTGDENDIFSLNLSIDDLGYTGWEARISKDRIDIPLGENKTVQISVTGPKYGNSNDYINITITAVSEGNSSINDSIIFRTFLIVNRGVNLQCQDNVHVTYAGVRTNYSIVVDNWGDSWEDIRINIIFNPEKWKVELSNDLFRMVPPHGIRNLTLTVTPPRYSPMEAADVTIEAKIVCYVHNYNSNLTTHTIVSGAPWVSMRTNASIITIEPGGNITVPFTIGTEDDCAWTPVNLTIVTKLQNGWNAVLDNTSFWLNWGGVENFDLVVQAPTNARLGERVTIQINATGYDYVVWLDSISIQLLVQHVVKLNISVSPKNITVMPGDSVTYNISLTDEGPKDETLAFGDISNNNGIAISFVSNSFPKHNIVLWPGLLERLQVRVEVPKNAKPGDWTNWIVLKDVSGKNWTIPIRTTIRVVHSIYLGMVRSDDLVAPGGSVRYEIEMINEGNFQENLSLVVRGIPLTWTYQIIFDGKEPMVVQIDPGATTTGSLYINVPWNFSYEDFWFELNITDPDGFSNAVKREIAVEGCELSLDHVSYKNSMIIPDREDYILVDVRNKGLSVCENVQVNFYDDGVLNGTATIERLPAGVNKTVIFAWTPKMAGPHRLLFKVDPDNKIKEANEDDNQLIDRVNARTGERWPDFYDAPCIGVIIALIALVLFIIILKLRDARKTVPKE